jgi:serine/threonine-protein kinase
MVLETVPALVEALRRGGLLEPGQLAQVEALATQADGPRALARELLSRDWLTAFQLNQLFAGRGEELLWGSYLLLERLGEGGMGAVYKARHRGLGRVVAVKLLRKERVANPLMRRRFRREIQVLAALVHPHVVHAYDAAEERGTCLLVMEYVEGVELSRLVREQGPLAVDRACEYIRQAALGLQHAHEHGLVHRDIKPANLLLAAKSGTVKLLDLGLARLMQPEEEGAEPSSALTQEGVVMGTPDFMAPEQAWDCSRVDIRADLYSLGCTLYFLLTGHVPFPGGPALQKMTRHLNDEPAPVEELRPEVPAGVAAVLRRLMAKRPEQRYQSPAELVQALAGLGSGGGAAPAPVLSPPAPAGPASEADTLSGGLSSVASQGDIEPIIRPHALPWTGARWHWLPLIGAAVSALLLLAGGLALLLRRGEPPPDPPAAKGRLVLASVIPNARVLVKQDGREVATLDVRTRRVPLPAGAYTLHLAGSAAGVRLTPDQVELQAGAEVEVGVLAAASRPLGSWALVSRPAPLQGVRGWTLVPQTGRGSSGAWPSRPGGRGWPVPAWTA